MNEIGIQDIQRDAKQHAELAAAFEAAQLLVSKLYPGHHIVICPTSIKQSDAANGAGKGRTKSIDHVIALMRENGQVMHTDAILDALKQRGVELQRNTLQSYMSRNPKYFQKQGRGMWKLKNAAP